MKNIKLLLATTAMLSMGAMAANAEQAIDDPVTSNNILMGAFVDVVSPITATIKEELMFPVLLADTGSNTVTVTTNGKVADGATATILNEASVTAGEVEFTGPFAALITAGRVTAAELENSDNIVLPTDDVDLTNLLDSSTKCGSITGFSKNVSYADGKVTVKIGGTYETADLSAMTTGGMRCMGDVSVTLLLADE